MVNQQLLDYIKHQLDAGVGKDGIKAALMKSGWAENDISEAFSGLGGSVPPQALPEQQNLNSLEAAPTLAGVGALFASAFVTFRKRFWPIVFLWLIGAAYSLIAVVPASILYAVSKNINVSGILVFGIGLVIAVGGLFWVIYVLLRTMFSLYLLIASPDDGSLTAWQVWKASSGKIRSFFWVGALSNLVAAGGFVLLIVPGIIILVMVTFAVWVMAIEGLRGRAALLRSRSYVKGRWWKIFWRLFVIWIIGVLVPLIFLGLYYVAGANVVVSIAQVLVTVLWFFFTFCYAYQLYVSAKATARLDPAAETAAKRKYTVLAVLGLLLPVLGLLASIALVSLNSARAKSRDAKRIADVRLIQTALEFYYNDANQYPPNFDVLIPGYVRELPKAPKPADGVCTPEQNEYSYKLSGAGNYELKFCLGGAVGGYGGGEHTANQKGIDQPADGIESTSASTSNAFENLINAGQTCTPSKAKLTINQHTGVGTIYVYNEQAEILGYSGQYCHFLSTRVGADVILDQALINESLASGQATEEVQQYLEALKQSLPSEASELRKNNIGMTQDCLFTADNLIAYLRLWQNWPTSSNPAPNLTKYCKFTPPSIDQIIEFLNGVRSSVGVGEYSLEIIDQTGNQVRFLFTVGQQSQQVSLTVGQQVSILGYKLLLQSIEPNKVSVLVSPPGK